MAVKFDHIFAGITFRSIKIYTHSEIAEPVTGYIADIHFVWLEIFNLDFPERRKHLFGNKQRTITADPYNCHSSHTGSRRYCADIISHILPRQRLLSEFLSSFPKSENGSSLLFAENSAKGSSSAFVFLFDGALPLLNAP